MKRLNLRFNVHPGGTLQKIVEMSNNLGLLIEGIEDVKVSKSISHKVVSVSGDDENLKKMKEMLVRVPTVTIKEE